MKVNLRWNSITNFNYSMMDIQIVTKSENDVVNKITTNSYKAFYRITNRGAYNNTSSWNISSSIKYGLCICANHSSDSSDTSTINNFNAEIDIYYLD